MNDIYCYLQFIKKCKNNFPLGTLGPGGKVYPEHDEHNQREIAKADTIFKDDHTISPSGILGGGKSFITSCHCECKRGNLKDNQIKYQKAKTSHVMK